MKIYLVRHGETDWNVEGRIQGHTDIPLNDHGIAQTEALRDQIAQQGLEFDAIYSSPLQRVRRTAEIIADSQIPSNQPIDTQPVTNSQPSAGTHPRIILDDRLKERHAGEFEGQPLGSLFNHEIDFLDPVRNAGDFGVEPFRDFQGRIIDFLDHLRNNYPDDARILVVTSNGIMKRMHDILYGNTQARPHFDNAALYEFEID